MTPTNSFLKLALYQVFVHFLCKHLKKSLACTVKIETFNLPLDNKNSIAVERKLIWKKLDGTDVENHSQHMYFQAPAKRIYEAFLDFDVVNKLGTPTVDMVSDPFGGIFKKSTSSSGLV
jgi:hypothetical protein